MALVALTRRADVMGALVNRRITTIAAVVIGLNLWLTTTAVIRLGGLIGF